RDEHEPRRPRHGGRRGLHRSGLHDHQGRPTGSSRGWTRPAGRQGRLGGTESQDARGALRSAMCGIVGYVGDKSAVGIIVEGLKRREYRGYDSAGIAVLNDGTLNVRRAAGRLKMLEGVLGERPLAGSLGIGHTRWATHGRPSAENAHPHTDCDGSLVVVHNGIIENYLEIKDHLLAQAHRLKSNTDPEIIAHLSEHPLT